MNGAEGLAPVVLTRAAVPTLADAQRAADSLAAAGVGQVVLFGSVARGDATERSDIDLIAIYDDLDYTRRSERRVRLQVHAAHAAGYPVDVVVTDQPEWLVRTTKVCTSLEARAARQGVVLVDRRPHDVDWEKEIEMPTDDYQEALYRLGLTHEALSKIRVWLEPSPLERIELELGNDERALQAYLQRLREACGQAQATVEASVKALIHLAADHQREVRGHNIAKLCEQLPGPQGRTIERLLHPCRADDVSAWHTRARNHRPERDPEPTADLVTGLTEAALRVATYAATHFHQDSTVDTVRAYAGHIESYLNGYDITTGQRLAIHRHRHGS